MKLAKLWNKAFPITRIFVVYNYGNGLKIEVNPYHDELNSGQLSQEAYTQLLAGSSLYHEYASFDMALQVDGETLESPYIGLIYIFGRRLEGRDWFAVQQYVRAFCADYRGQVGYFN